MNDLNERKRKKKPGSFYREQNKKKINEADKSSSLMKGWLKKNGEEGEFIYSFSILFCF